jgi:hypothetical protein
MKKTSILLNVREVGVVAIEVDDAVMALQQSDALFPGYVAGKVFSVGAMPLRQKKVEAWGFTDPTLRRKLSWAVSKIKHPPQRTPLTKENLLKWAKAEVRRVPYYDDRVYDQKLKTFKDVKRKNSVHRQLMLILLERDTRSFREDDRYDIVEAILELCQNGVKGYKQQTISELLDQIDDELIDQKNSPYDLKDLEDLLEEFDLLENDDDDETS